MIAWLFFALSVLFLLVTLNSFRPTKKNRILYIPSFFGSWLTNELSSLYLLAMVGVVLGFLIFGQVLSTGEGWVGLIIMAVTWALLGIIYARGLAARKEVAKALDGYGADIHPQRTRRSSFKKTKNITFARVGGRKLKLDVTMPKESGAMRPAMLQLHGGGWVIGDKREQGLPLIRRLVSNGWVCFNANYRLSPGATWPEHLEDCKRAVAWIREHADEYGVDPDFIAVTGGSAGGHLSSMVALTSDDVSLQPGFEEADCSVQAAVPFYGVYDFTNRIGAQQDEMTSMVLEPLVVKAFFSDEPEKFVAASPTDRVNPDAPPFFVLHGDKDTLAPVEDARLFVERLRETSENPVFYAELVGAQHAFDVFSSPRTRRVACGVVQFVTQTHKDYLEAKQSVDEASSSTATARAS